MEQGEDELQIMIEFMHAEKRRQKAKERMGTSDNSGAKHGPNQQVECQNCGLRGHQTADSRKPKNANKSHGTQLKSAEKKSHSSFSQQPGIPRPACNLHHPIPASNGRAMMYETSLSLCLTLKVSVSRTRLLFWRNQ